MAISYSHPYIQTNIYDDSEIYTSTSANGCLLYQPYFSERGISGELEEFSDLADFLKAKGNPNMRLYGQSMYNITQWLRHGGRVLGIRLVADDSTYANVGLNIRTKDATKQVEVDVLDEEGNIVYEEDGITPKKETKTVPSVDVKLETVTIPSLEEANDESVKLIIDEYVKNNTASDDYKDHIIMLLRSKGRGTYGNNISVRITPNKQAKNTYDFAAYNLTVVETKPNGSIRTSEGPTSMSLYPDALSLGGGSLFIKQIIDDYFKEIACYFNEDAYDTLIDEIMEITKNAYDHTGDIDLLFGDDYINVDNTGAASLFAYSGCYFESGDDGELFVPRTTSQGVMDKLMIAAFDGSLTSKIYDKELYPIDVILDCNSRVEVKNAMNSFVNQRGDCVLMLDTCEQASAATTVNWKKQNLIIDDYLTSIWSQMFTVYDTYTAQDIYVSPTYFLADKIPATDNSYGVQYPFVGPNRGIITGFKTLNWNPNEDEKEELYDNQINYVEQNYKNTKFMGQLTAQSKTTSLSDINHVRCMLKIIRSVEELAKNYIFELADNNTISSLNSALENILSPWVSNGTCTTCQGTCSQTALEAAEKTAHITLNIVFVDVIEKIIIDVNVTR